MSAHSMPAGMVPVTRDEFLAALYADPRDIMPSLNHPNYTTWETKFREVWGWTTPGWKNPGDEKAYAVFPAAIAKAKGGAA